MKRSLLYPPQTQELVHRCPGWVTVLNFADVRRRQTTVVDACMKGHLWLICFYANMEINEGSCFELVTLMCLIFRYRYIFRFRKSNALHHCVVQM